jgi:hypothetical protein
MSQAFCSIIKRSLRYILTHYGQRAVKANPENLKERALLSGKFATKGFSFSAGGGIATPFGSGNIGAGLEFKGWEQAVPLAVEIVRALSKGQSVEPIL